MKKYAIIVGMLLAVCSCSHFDFHMRQGAIRPKHIMIGYFERRSVSFNPFAVQNFRDSLGFELFSMGYRVTLFKEADDAKLMHQRQISPEAIKDECQKHGADVFLQGVISEQEIGDFTDTDTSTLVSLFVYDVQGEKIGEGRYISSRTMSDVNTLRGVAGMFAHTLRGRFGD